MSKVREKRPSRCGTTLVIIVLLMVVLVALVAFAVDVGRMYLVRSQLQSAVDSGALAAGLTLRDDPTDIDGAVAAAEDFVQRNRVGWLVTVPEDSISVQAGIWDPETLTFDAGNTDPDAVEVAVSANDEPLFFARVLGHTSFSVPRSAVARAGGVDLDAVLTLDLSGSMGYSGRIEALHAAAPEFVNVIESLEGDDYIAVMGYGALHDVYDPVEEGHSGVEYLLAPAGQQPSTADTWVGVLESGLSNDFNFLRNSVLDSGTLLADKYNSYTPTGAALRDSAHYLNANSRANTQTGVDKVIVLMSDGLANRPSGSGSSYALQMASYADSLDIKVYTISLGNSADTALMTQIANQAGGKHYEASGTGSELTSNLLAAFRDVANAIKHTQLVK